MSEKEIIVYGLVYITIYAGVIGILYLGLHWRAKKIIQRHRGDEDLNAPH